MGKTKKAGSAEKWTRSVLRDEIAWFNTNQKKLQAEHPGMWVAVRHHRVVGVAQDMLEAAMQAERAGIKGYLLRHVDHVDEIAEL